MLALWIFREVLHREEHDVKTPYVCHEPQVSFVKAARKAGIQHFGEGGLQSAAYKIATSSLKVRS